MRKKWVKKSAALAAASLLLVNLLGESATAKSGSVDPASSLASQQLKYYLAESNPDKDKVYISKDIDTSKAGSINVLVQLSQDPLTVQQYNGKLRGKTVNAAAVEQTIQKEQTAFASKAKASGIALDVQYQYNKVLNGMAIAVNANQISQLAQIAGVKGIYANYDYYALPEMAPVSSGGGAGYESYPLEKIGADQAWAEGLTGKGVKIGVLDTGIDYKHPDLKDAYVGGWDSIEYDNDPYEDAPIEGVSEGTLHGTHVSGTIAGRAVNNFSTVVQKGVAYEAELYVYRVLDAYERGNSATIIDGIEHAVNDGMDVINLSLGSNEHKDPKSLDTTAINNAVLSGVTAVVASGNAAAGNYYYSMGSPANSPLVITVAAATTPDRRYSATATSSLTPDVDYSLLVQKWKLGEEDFHQVLGNEPIDGVYAGFGMEEDYEKLEREGVSVEGKIVFASEGYRDYPLRINLAKAHHAKALILFNGTYTVDEYFNVIPDLSDDNPWTDGQIEKLYAQEEPYADSWDYIPVLTMSGKDGRALAKEALSNLDTPLQFTFGDNFAVEFSNGNHIANYSSRGPSMDGEYSIKPDISAPGDAILSTVPAYGKMNANASYAEAYARLSGTSMATPHITGLVALLKQQHKDWTPRDIRAALANTSQILVDESETQYDVYSQGSGLANVAAAIQTPALLESLDQITIYDEKLKPSVIESEASNLSFGVIDPKSDAAVTKPLQLKNTSNDSVTYTATVKMHEQVTSDPRSPIPTPDVSKIQLTLGELDGTSITVAAHEAHRFTLTAQADADAEHGVYEGEVVLESEGLPPLHLPFVIHVGDDVKDSDFGLQNIKLSGLKMGKSSPIDISLTVEAGWTNRVILYAVDAEDNYMGLLSSYSEIDEGTRTVKNIEPGTTISFEELDGSFFTEEYDESGKPEILSLDEGVYDIGILAGYFSEDGTLDGGFHRTFRSIYVENSQSEGEPPVSVPNPDPVPNPGPDPGPSPDPDPSPSPDPNPSPVPSPGKGSNPNPSDSEKSDSIEAQASVIEKGQTSVALATTSTLAGKTLNVTLTDEELKKAIETSPTSAAAFVVSVASVDSTAGKLQLTAEQVKLLQGAPSGSSIVFSWNTASLALPLSALSRVSSDTALVLNISEDAGSKPTFTAQYKDTQVLGTPYGFEVGTVKNGKETPLTLDASQPIKRAFLIGKGNDTHAAGALYEEAGKVYPIPAKFTAASDGNTVVTISRPGFSTYAAVIRQIAFSDIGTSWAKEQIQSLANQFILNGTSASKFSPKSNVTRAQFATMLVNALGLKKTAAAAPFSDIAANAWYAQDVAAAYAAGLVLGADGKFQPNAEITRQDLTVMLARAIKLLSLSSGDSSISYADAGKFASYAKDSIETVTAVGLMQGVKHQDGIYFHPSDATTREAAAKVLYELLRATKLN